jgi:hypothetical protein
MLSVILSHAKDLVLRMPGFLASARNDKGSKRRARAVETQGDGSNAKKGPSPRGVVLCSNAVNTL